MNAITIKLTWPTTLVMRPAPYRNGMLLTVPTVMVMPGNGAALINMMTFKTDFNS